MNLIVKYFFLADVLFLGSAFDLDTYIFPWRMQEGGGVKLESSCIQVNTVYISSLNSTLRVQKVNNTCRRCAQVTDTVFISKILK